MSEREPPRSDAEQELRDTLASGSARADEYRALADLLIESDRHEEAAALYEEALARLADDLTRARLLMELGELYAIAVNRVSDAEVAADQALRLLTHAGAEPRVAYCRGSAEGLLVNCLAWKDPVAARAMASRALASLQPALERLHELPIDERLWTRIGAASHHSFLGDYEAALTHCEPAFQEAVAPKDRLACVSVYAEALSGAGHPREARDLLLRQIAGVAPPQRALPWLHLALANAQLAENDVTGARASLLQALDLGRAHPATRDDGRLLGEVWANLGFVGYQLELYEEAENAYRQALGYCHSLGRNDAGPRLGLGMCQRIRGDLDAAWSTLRAAVAAAPPDPSSVDGDRFLADAWLTLGQINSELARHEEAIEALDTALRHLDEENAARWNALLWLAASNAALDRVGDAARLYRRVLDSPHAADADKASAREGLDSLPQERRGLGSWRGRAGLRLRVLWQHAVFWTVPTPPEHHHATLGKLHFELGRHRRAIRHFERAEALRAPTDRQLADFDVYYLGFAHLHAGEYVKAREYFMRSLFFRRDDPHVRQALTWTTEQISRSAGGIAGAP